MTIAYKNTTVYYPRKIRVTLFDDTLPEWSGARKREINASLTPDKENANRETVIISEKRGSGGELVFRKNGISLQGAEINSDKTCKEIGISWWDPEAIAKKQSILRLERL